MTSKNLVKLVTAALMAALSCVATFLLPIQIPYGNGGYIHPGDAFVLLSGIILGPVYGGLAAGIGSMLADIIVGAPQYAIATLIIKALAAIIASITYRKIKIRPVLFAGILGGFIVTIGYFLFDALLTGNFLSAALAGIPFNLLQNLFGIILSSLLFPLLIKVPSIKEIMNDSN